MNTYIVAGPKNHANLHSVCLGRLFYDSLKTKHPSDILIVDYHSGDEISREQLLETTLKLAAALCDFGVSRGDVIGIISVNSWKFLATVISGFYVGATVTAINPNSSKDELLDYLTISKPKILFVSTNLVDNIDSLRDNLSFIKNIVMFEESLSNRAIFFEDLLKKYADYTTCKIQDDEIDDALLLYSSGTTGFPKGVNLTETTVKMALLYCSNPDIINMKENSTVSGILPLFHIFGLLVPLGCVVYAKKVVLMDKFKPDIFLRSIQEHKITTLIVVPPIVQFLAKSPLVEDYDLTSVKDIVCGAATLGKDAEEMAANRLQITVRQLYGLTETCAITCMPPGVRKPGSVGKVVPGHQVKIVDPNSGDVLDRYGNGEIWFKGPALMKGYKDNDEKTREIVDDEGFLHTGDIGYFDDEGYLYVVDRIKDLIKYKGFQVAPAQLENLLSKHPAVEDVAVIGTPDEKAGELPTALVVRRSTVEITKEDLIKYVADRFSVEKHLHGGVIFVDEIPRTNSGKILKRELRKIWCTR